MRQRDQQDLPRSAADERHCALADYAEIVDKEVIVRG